MKMNGQKPKPDSAKDISAKARDNTVSGVPSLFPRPTTDEETEYFNKRKKRLRESEDGSDENPSY